MRFRRLFCRIYLTRKRLFRARVLTSGVLRLIKQSFSRAFRSNSFKIKARFFGNFRAFLLYVTVAYLLFITRTRRENLRSVCVPFLCRIKRRLRRRNSSRRASIRTIRVNVNDCSSFIMTRYLCTIFCVRNYLGRIRFFIFVGCFLNRSMKV